MSKRHTDTEKWKQPWYRKLTSVQRDIRNFLLDDCDHAGVWWIDLERVEFFTGQKTNLEEIAICFNHKIVYRDEILILLDFIDSQYKNVRNQDRCTISAVARLKALGIEVLAPTKDLASPYLGVKEKDKDKDKEKEEAERCVENVDNSSEESLTLSERYQRILIAIRKQGSSFPTKAREVLGEDWKVIEAMGGWTNVLRLPINEFHRNSFIKVMRDMMNGH